jgi:nucleotide-binding universal stress UspA family protein
MIRPLYRNVLILINGSESSIQAAKYGILMSKLYRCNLKALYVVDTATLKQLMLNKFFVAEESKEYEASLTLDGKKYLQYVEDLAKSKGVKIETEIKNGSVWSETVSMAESMEADLILLGGFDSNTRDQKDILSTSYREILINAPCSVQLVREKMIDQLYKLA